ncbi:MAG: hypothetical protein AAF098_04625, partial [Pseudomonadota bacterium]
RRHAETLAERRRKRRNQIKSPDTPDSPGALKANMPCNSMVDCSHANSNKNPALQPLVAEGVANQILTGNESIMGLMIESHLERGKQSMPEDLSQLRYGVSLTDGCISWADTQSCLRSVADKLSEVYRRRRA